MKILLRVRCSQNQIRMTIKGIFCLLYQKKRNAKTQKLNTLFTCIELCTLMSCTSCTRNTNLLFIKKKDHPINLTGLYALVLSMIKIQMRKLLIGAVHIILRKSTKFVLSKMKESYPKSKVLITCITDLTADLWLSEYQIY